VLDKLKENKRKKKHKTLEDFTKEKTKDHNQSKTTTEDNSDEVRPNQETNLTSAPISHEIAMLVRQEVQKAISEMKVQMNQSISKSCPKKKRNPIYIRDEDEPTFLKFRKGNEPLKETLPRVIRAAGRYLQMTGDSEVH